MNTHSFFGKILQLGPAVALIRKTGISYDKPSSPLILTRLFNNLQLLPKIGNLEQNPNNHG